MKLYSFTYPYIIPAIEHCLKIISFFVKVPVLSEKIYFTYLKSIKINVSTEISFYLTQFFIQIRCSCTSWCIGLTIIHVYILKYQANKNFSFNCIQFIQHTQLIKYAWINLTKSTVICNDIGIKLLKRIKNVKNV